MTAGDEGDDDPMLRGMRSVWLEMREEDPPGRGLAELMAAARTQATAMKPAEEPWWRRAFAVLLRPPMLAAATVIVLIGGAVVLKSRGNDEVAAPIASMRAENDELRKADNDRPAVEPTPTPTLEGKASGSGSAQASPGGATIVASPPPPPRVRLVQPKPPAKPSGGDVKDHEEDKEKTEKAPQKDQVANGLVIANDGQGEVAGRVTEKQTVRPSSDPKVDAARPEAPKGDTIQSTKVQRPPQVSTEQLIKQAETAAGRNDCPAVRATADRIRKLDASTFKSRVANQPAIARCLK